MYKDYFLQVQFAFKIESPLIFLQVLLLGLAHEFYFVLHQQHIDKEGSLGKCVSFPSQHTLQ